MNSFVLVQPVITEKSLMLAQTLNAYTFQVDRGATKDQVKHAVESLYGVSVTSVNTIFGHRSLEASGKRRIKRVQPKLKKAVVSVKAGQSIEIFDIQGGQAQAK